VLESGAAVVYWFTYDTTGGQRWFFGTGNAVNDTVVFDTLLVTTGPVFGDQFEPDDVIYTEVGSLSIKWTDCSTAIATYTIDGTAGSQALSRLTTVAGLDCEAPISTSSPMSGSWFDQTHNGEGLAIEILNDGSTLVFWFSYDGDGKQAWFLWLAFNAPHTPFHLPPANLHSRDLSGTESDIAANPLPYYFAAIEAMDTEMSRLLGSLDAETLANTIIIFLGDNGTPGQVAQFPYSRSKAKGSLYQGGVNVPLFISSPGITRTNERETALVNTTDLFSTIAALAGVNVGQVNDSISFESLLSEKEMQSLVDYTRSPDTTGSAAIDPLSNSTGIINEAGDADYPAYWTGTTHVNWTTNPGASGAYINFGRSMGYMNNNWVDVHGAGAQRSDPKVGDPADYPTGRGPQGDAIRIYNHVRLVRSTQ